MPQSDENAPNRGIVKIGCSVHDKWNKWKGHQSHNK